MKVYQGGIAILWCYKGTQDNFAPSMKKILSFYD